MCVCPNFENDDDDDQTAPEQFHKCTLSNHHYNFDSQSNVMASAYREDAKNVPGMFTDVLLLNSRSFASFNKATTTCII